MNIHLTLCDGADSMATSSHTPQVYTFGYLDRLHQGGVDKHTLGSSTVAKFKTTILKFARFQRVLNRALVNAFYVQSFYSPTQLPALRNIATNAALYT